MNKDSKLIAESYQQVILREGIISTLLGKSIGWAFGKIMNLMLSPQKKLEIIEKMMEVVILKFEQYKDIKRRLETDPGSVEPDEVRSIKSWEQANISEEEFKSTIEKSFVTYRTAVEQSKKLTDHDKNWLLNKHQEIVDNFNQELYRILAN